MTQVARLEWQLLPQHCGDMLCDTIPPIQKLVLHRLFSSLPLHYFNVFLALAGFPSESHNIL